METIDPYTYKLSSGEPVTLKVTPMNGAMGQRFVASCDGAEVPNSGTDAEPKFTFSMSAEVGNSHFMKVEAGFVEEDPAEAQYKLEIVGSDDQPYPIKRTDTVLDPTFEFAVTA